MREAMETEVAVLKLLALRMKGGQEPRKLEKEGTDSPLEAQEGTSASNTLMAAL